MHIAKLIARLRSRQASEVSTSPTALDLETLALVSGGSPRGTWAQAEPLGLASPRGTWSASPRGTWAQAEPLGLASPRGTWSASPRGTW